MSPTRFDMYAFIHKALRAMMSDALVAVGRLDVTDPEEVAQKLSQVRALLAACTSHLRHENEFIHPAIEARMPGASLATAEEHQHHQTGSVALENRITAVEQAAAADRPVAAHALYLDLAGFVADQFAHMQLEERDNNRVLQAAYTDAELLAIQGRLIDAIPPQEMTATLRWMLPSLAAPERAELLAGLATKMPRDAFCEVLALARQNLSGRDWFKLMMALGPMPLAA